MYKSDGGKKQVPNNPIYGGNEGTGSNQKKNFNYAATPAAMTVAERPDHVLINGHADGGTYMFKYTSTGSLGATIPAAAGKPGGGDGAWVSGALHNGEGGAIKLEVNPNAWKRVGAHSTGNVGVAGEVTFVYSKQDK